VVFGSLISEKRGDHIMKLPERRGYHVIYDSTLRDAMQYASEHNWTAIVPDFGVPRFSPELFSATQRKELQELSAEMNIEWGFHAPGDDISLFSSYPPIRKSIIEYFREIVDFARDVSSNSTNVVVHTGSPPRFRKSGETKGDFINENFEIYETVLLENLIDLIEYASPDVHIVLENHGWTSLVRHAIPSLIARGMKLCLDIPKLYDANFELLSDWRLFQQYPDSIEVVHIHDAAPSLGSHLVIGEGVIDFRSSLEFLSKATQTIQYVFEVRPRDAATTSLNKFKSLIETIF